MEVFVVNGAPISMSSRPGSALKKPAVFQNPQNKPPPRKNNLTLKRPIKAPSKRKKAASPKKAPKNETVYNDSSCALMVKLPSVDDGEDYVDNHSSPSPSSASSKSSSKSFYSSKTTSDEEEEEDDENASSIPAAKEEESAIESSADERENFSRSNSPWFSQHENEQEEVIQAQPEPSCTRKSLTPETLVQLIDDDATSLKNEDDDEIVNDELHAEAVDDDDGACNDDEGIEEPKDEVEEGNVLARAIAGNKKRLEKILHSDNFYESMKNNAEEAELANQELAISPALVKNADQADFTISHSTDTVTLPSSCSFTPDNNEDINGGYNDILNVLERLEKETNDNEDKDSGRPLSDSPKRTISSKSTSSHCSNEKQPARQHQGGSKIR